MLAGGASRRMGFPKALVPVAGVPLGRAVADVLRSAVDGPVVVQGASAEVAEVLDLPLIPDLMPGAGPLAAFATAAAWCNDVGRDLVVVAACDQPSITPSTIEALIRRVTDVGPDREANDVVVAAPRSADGRFHPFPTVWSCAAAAGLREMVEAGHRRADAGFVLGVVGVAVADRELVDLDSPDDVRRFESGRNRSRPPMGGGAAP